MLDALPTDISAVAAFQVSNPPLATFKSDLGMMTANVFVFDANVAFVKTSDAERSLEPKLLSPTGTLLKTDFQQRN